MPTDLQRICDTVRTRSSRTFMQRGAYGGLRRYATRCGRRHAMYTQCGWPSARNVYATGCVRGHQGCICNVVWTSTRNVYAMQCVQGHQGCICNAVRTSTHIIYATLAHNVYATRCIRGHQGHLCNTVHARMEEIRNVVWTLARNVYATRCV